MATEASRHADGLNVSGTIRNFLNQQMLKAVRSIGLFQTILRKNGHPKAIK
jgi:hypothetical protein